MRKNFKIKDLYSLTISPRSNGKVYKHMKDVVESISDLGGFYDYCEAMNYDFDSLDIKSQYNIVIEYVESWN